MLLIESKNLLQLFERRVSSSHKIDIASAWATRSSALDTLVNAAKGRSIRAIIGTSGRATDPDALDALNKIGELRLPDQYPLFHPKVYLFRGRRHSFAWIGSANFTAAGGFGRSGGQDLWGNTETLFETPSYEAVLDWFEKKWFECGVLRFGQLEQYRSKRLKRPPNRYLRRIVAGPRIGEQDRSDFLDEASNWRGYMVALENCNEWWRYHSKEQGKFSVLGEENSWVQTISVLQSITKKEDWSLLEREDSERLLGLSDGDGGWALLGNMRGAGKACSSFQGDVELRRRIGHIVNRVVTADESEFPQCAVDAIKQITGPQFEGFGRGVATRLLTLARPDKCVSVNEQSRNLLVRKFDNVGSLTTPDGYGRLLKEVYKAPWHSTPEPYEECERKLWNMRAALVDCFVYERAKSRV